ncbi:hypothetical protein ACFV6U_06825 [Streptomyces sp. NPDC059810]|uniref:hypothetical protein n=1 Tax=Streptomyces sp. NPDC059810 TaxID=3346956 RepID=UPI003647479B
MSTNTPKPVLTRAAEAETTSDPSSTMTLLADCGTDSSQDSSELYDNHYVDSPLWRATLETAAE